MVRPDDTRVTAIEQSAVARLVVVRFTRREPKECPPRKRTLWVGSEPHAIDEPWRCSNALGAGHRVGCIVLEGSFTSAADVGAAHAFRFLPVRLLMKDQFRSDLRIAGVTAPLLFLHGGATG